MHALTTRIRCSVRPLALLAALTLMAGCGAAEPGDAPEAGEAQDANAQASLAFVGVNVVPMDAERVLEDQTVLIHGERIARVGPAAQVEVPAGAVRVDGQGRYLMPGIAEMHGHLPGGNVDPQIVENILFLFVANGVTTVRGMQGNPAQLEMRRRIEAGELVGPTLYLAGPAMSGNSAPTREDARRMVREQHAAGFDLLKVHGGLAREVYDAIVETAREVGITWGGHVSQLVGVERAIEAGQKSIDHLDGYINALATDARAAWGEDGDGMRVFAERTRDAGVWNVPTMALWETFNGAEALDALMQRPELRYMPRATVEGWRNNVAGRLERLDREEGARVIALRNQLLMALVDAGAPIALGSDAPQLFSVPGFSLHREMQAMAAAGMTPYQILESGTRNIAVYFDALDEFGTVEEGKRADLILVEGNPLEDVGHVARRAGVVLRGQWLPEAEIQRRLDGIAAAYAAAD